jgi:hypothetical protein
VKVRRNGRLVWVKRTTTVPSKQLGLFNAWVRGWHESLAPEYQGAC